MSMNFKKNVLLFPPCSFSTFGYPHLGIPSLIGYLNSKDYTDVHSIDLNSRYKVTPSNISSKLFLKKRAIADYSYDLLGPQLLMSYRSVKPNNADTLYDFTKALYSNENTKIIGFSLTYPEQVPVSIAMAKTIKKNRSHLILICGGAMVTENIKSYIKDDEFKYFDALIVGDGEEPVLRIVNQSGSEAVDFSKIPNCYYKKNKEFIFSDTNFLMDPKQFVLPAFENASYHKLPIRMSKGCYWRKCTFCSYRSIFNGYLAPDVNRVVGHIEKLQRKWHVKDFILIDDSLPPKVMYNFSKALIQAKLNIKWDCSTIFDQKLTLPEFAELIASSGCNTIFFGFESANERILSLMGKINKMHMVLKVLENLTAHNISAHLNVIIGFPSETTNEAEETIDFLRKYRHLYSSFSLQKFSLERGTEIYNSLSKFGISQIKEDICDKNISGRKGLEFETVSGMNPKQRHYMTLKGISAYKRKSVSLPSFLKSKLKSKVYFLVNYNEIAHK